MRKDPVGSDPLDVAVAVIRREGQFLIAQRKAEDSFGGCWEFPGGKLLPGERLEDCIVREIREELDLQIAVDSKLEVVEHRYPHRVIRLHSFLCRVVAGQPRAIECAAWRWVPPSELDRYRFPPASGPLIALLLGSDPGGSDPGGLRR
ncbi:MAG: 8-oxo-dGTP diphosphatase MutT [Candidatus Omnitrophica bacterium]|nr:8-oxo-dGTP diphosphatase MutT [Candidatus Omnitrophota bacterium]